MPTTLLILSALCAVGSYASLIAGMIRTRHLTLEEGAIRPHQTTRLAVMAALMLNFVSIIIVRGQLSDQIIGGVYAVLAVVVYIMSRKLGVPGGRIVDKICLAIALVGGAACATVGQSVIGIWFAIVADIAAYTPTFIKAWQQPHSEDRWTYAIGAASALFALLAGGVGLSSAFTVYLLVADLLLVTLLMRKPRVSGGTTLLQLQRAEE